LHIAAILREAPELADQQRSPSLHASELHLDTSQNVIDSLQRL
jgi:hypothetical protein